jgi:hypothetical protein
MMHLITQVQIQIKTEAEKSGCKPGSWYRVVGTATIRYRKGEAEEEGDAFVIANDAGTPVFVFAYRCIVQIVKRSET